MDQVAQLVRALLNDAPGNVFTDTVLLPYINSGYRTVQRKIANAGGGGFIQDDVLLVVPAVPTDLQDPSTQVVINDATPPPNQLPSNLLVPLRIRERPNPATVLVGQGPPYPDFVQMVDRSQTGGLPSRMQEQTLGEWEWRSDGIYFVGATQDTQIELRMQVAFPDLTGPNDVILIRGAQEPIAHAAAGLAGLARGSEFVDKMENLFADSVGDVILENVRREQNVSRRRRPYGRGQGLRRGSAWPWDTV